MLTHLVVWYYLFSSDTKINTDPVGAETEVLLVNTMVAGSLHCQVISNHDNY